MAKNEGDILIYALYPTTGMRFLKWKYGHGAHARRGQGQDPGADQAWKTTVYLTIKQKKLFAKVKEYLDALDQTAPGEGPGPGTFNVFVDGQPTTRWRWSAPPGPR